MTDLASSPLGHATVYADAYDRTLLFPVERAPLRARLGWAEGVPWTGEDVWNAYEVSWLHPSGKPAVAIATFRVDAGSPRIVESKSVKLYLTALNQTAFASADAVRETMRRDLTAATGSDVQVALVTPDGFADLLHAEPAGLSLDALPLAVKQYEPDPEALVTEDVPVEETLHTRLFRSLCPVTGQPDYATVVINYRGARIAHEGLLRYLVGFRRAPGFHEHCVEQVFTDLWRRCTPAFLAVEARFTRRGGIDINPYRSSVPTTPPANARTARQ